MLGECRGWWYCKTILSQTFQMKVYRLLDELLRFFERLTRSDTPGKVRNKSSKTSLTLLNDDGVSHRLTSNLPA